MPPIVTTVLEFLGQYTMWLVGISLTSFIVGLVSLPILIARIPADYFSHPHRQRLSARARHPLVRLLLLGIKNLLGALLVTAGLVMLFTPGQGLITLLVGLMIMNYPGKFALERWVVTRPHILPGINWLRQRYGHPPLQPPGDER